MLDERPLAVGASRDDRWHLHPARRRSGSRQHRRFQITLPAGTYKLTIPSTGSDDPSTGDLDVNNLDNGASITINGAGSSSTVINANFVDRAFTVHSDTTTGGLTLSGMTIENGSPSNNSTDGEFAGGAIDSYGALSVTSDVIFKANGAFGLGGAIASISDTSFPASSASSLSLNGATFEGNDVFIDIGGAIYDGSPNLATITNSRFSGNSAPLGGAIFADDGGVNISSSTFSQNTAAGTGGAIFWATYSDLNVTNSTFSQNNGGGGGGVMSDSGVGPLAAYAKSHQLPHVRPHTLAPYVVTFTGDHFTGNSAEYNCFDEECDFRDPGGAFYLGSYDAQYTFNQDEFDGNTDNDEGGAIYWGDGSLDIHSSSFTGNTGGYDGGALYADSLRRSLTLVNSTISHNSAEFGGGIDFDQQTPVAITNDTIAFNSAGALGGSGYSGGGGVYGADNVDSTPADYTPPVGDTSETAGIENTVIAENAGGDCNTLTSGPDTFPPTAEPNGHNMDSDTSCFGGSSAPGDQPGVNPNLGQPADNGGPSAGDPNTGQTTLLTDSDLGSPTVDAGTNTGCPATDERGVTRDDDPCDIGAYESTAAALSVTKSAPSSATVGSAFDYTITVTDNGPAPATGTTVTDQLPANTTLFGVDPSQGSCAPSTGSSPKVTCSLGVIPKGSSATITMVVSVSKAGSVTNTATATDNEGSSVSGSATTNITGVVLAAFVSKPLAITGPSSNVKTTSAKISGTVKPGGQATTYFFQYGTSTFLGKVSFVGRSGTSNKSVRMKLTGLTPDTVYYYRLVATNDSGTSYGRIRRFKTKGVKAVKAIVVHRPPFTG